MNDIVELSWRAYPAALMMVLGVAAAMRSAVTHTRRARQLRDPARALAIMRGFRLSIVSLAAAAIGIAWWWQIGWLFVLALVIGGEELLESTVVITALAYGPGEKASNTRLDGRASVRPSTVSTRCGRRLAAGDGRVAVGRSGQGVAPVAALAAQQDAQ